MKQLFKKILLLNLIVLFTLSSCVKDEVTSIELDKSAIAINIGQTDSLNVTIALTGDINSQPLSWSSSNNDVVLIEEGSSTTASSSKSNTITKQIFFTALKTGNTIITLQAGNKTVSCNISVDQRDLIFNQAFTSNYGDYYDIGNNSFDMYLLENTLSVNSSGELEGTGTMLYLDFTVPITQSAMTDAQFLPASNGDINTFFPGEAIENNGETYLVGSRIETFTETEATIWLIKDGQYTVTSDGDNFHLEGELITEDNEVIHFSYDGVIAVTDKREPVVEISPAFTKGELYYYGDAYNSTTTNNFSVYLATETVNYSDSILNGEILMLEFNTSLTVKDSIPNGTYDMMTELSYAQLMPYSLVFGYNSENGNDYGSWYYSTETTKKLKTGSFVSTKTGDQYKINYTLFDRFGSKVSGEYNGPLTYNDATQSSSSVSMAKVKGKNTHKSFSGIKKEINRIRPLRIHR